MTQHRIDPDRLSNYFDRLLEGIGHRGSSFTDLDLLNSDGCGCIPFRLSAITHDGRTERFIIQEFKYEGETISRGQRRTLIGLARKPDFTVWIVIKRDDGLLDFCDVATDRSETISTDEYKSRFKDWWENRLCENAWQGTNL